MHPFYKRMDIILAAKGTTRHSFCKKYGYKPNTLQNYWGTNKLPPGNIVADLCEFVEESADYFLFGREKHLRASPEREATIEMLDLLTEENHQAALKFIKFLLNDQMGNRSLSNSGNKS